jgi:hypothetical protein
MLFFFFHTGCVRAGKRARAIPTGKVGAIRPANLLKWSMCLLA